MIELLALHYIHMIDVQLLLWGNDSLTNTQITDICKTVVNVVASIKNV